MSEPTHSNTRSLAQALNPSSSSNASTNNSAISRDSTAIEQLRAEVDRIRQAAALDVQNLQNDLIAKNREIGRLKAELAKAHEEEPEHDEVRELLLLWKALTLRNAKTDVKPGGKRYKLVKTAVKRWGRERCENAIQGLALKPYAGPRGRSHIEYPGSKKYADVEHALGDEVRMENCEQIWHEHLEPTLLEPPVEPDREPESETRQFVRYAYGDNCQLPYVPASKERRRPERPWDDTAPIDKVLGALNRLGCQWRATNNPDAWMAQCPGHDDRTPSLSIARKPDGMVLLNCMGPCETDHVLGVMDLDWRDLWTGSENDHERLDGPRTRKVVPAHLRQAMRQLIELEERAA